MVMKFCCVILFLSFSHTFAQDIIYTNDGRKINAKIIEANDEGFKFKSLHNPYGPTYALARTEIKEIVFKNGEVEVFRNATLPSTLSTAEIGRASCRDRVYSDV